MKHFTNRELSMIAQEMIITMRSYGDVELDEYADQYNDRLYDIYAHGVYHDDDTQLQEELHDDYVELILTIHRTLDDYRRSRTRCVRYC